MVQSAALMLRVSLRSLKSLCVRDAEARSAVHEQDYRPHVKRKCMHTCSLLLTYSVEVEGFAVINARA